jgi:phytoene dehydrogenase-like protein
VRERIAIIIGSGIAGLACAAQMAARGWRVQVFEKATMPGGKLGLLEKEGFAFDTGPSLFTQPFL